MRASDLIGLDVVDRRGERVGVVTDLRCVDGPVHGALATAGRITFCRCVRGGSAVTLE